MKNEKFANLKMAIQIQGKPQLEQIRNQKIRNQKSEIEFLWLEIILK